MQYLDRQELRRLLSVAHKNDPVHHLALLASLLHGLRVSEVLGLRGTNVQSGHLYVQRLKRSKPTLQALRIDSDPLFDESPLMTMAAKCSDAHLFNWSRQYMDKVIKRYGAEAGIPEAKLHHHALKHSIAMILWKETLSLSAIQDHLGHRSASSSLLYMRTDQSAVAQQIVTSLKF
jgi:integrase/recombinase XerD